MTASTKPRSISAHEAHTLVAAGRAVLVDIREPMEHARERIVGARSLPLSRLGHAPLERAGATAMIFHCQSGNRTAVNAGKLADVCGPHAYVLAGGLQAWKAAGLPVTVNRKAPIDLMRQVQIVTGSFAAAGAVLAVAVSPWFILLSGAVGAGLVFAGITGLCGMARLLGRMPWNRAGA